MGVVSWMSEHSPKARFDRVVSGIFAYNEGTSATSPKDYYNFIMSSGKLFAHETSGFGQDMAFMGGVVFSRGGSLVTPQTVTAASTGQGFFYDPGVINPDSLIPFSGMLKKQSPRQDTLTSTSDDRVPKTRGGTKSSRGAKSPQTLKPFWSNGKPKCRKGYRYDFKRKMCVKKS